MATVRLDVRTEAALKRLSVRRGQTKSEVLRDAIARLEEESEEGDQSAYQRLRPYIGIVDSGGQQLSEKTGQRRRRSPQGTAACAQFWLTQGLWSRFSTAAMPTMRKSWASSLGSKIPWSAFGLYLWKACTSCPFPGKPRRRFGRSSRPVRSNCSLSASRIFRG